MRVLTRRFRASVVLQKLRREMRAREEARLEQEREEEKQARPSAPSRLGLCGANLAAVGWVLRGYSEQYSGFQTVIVCMGFPQGDDGL